MKQSASLTIIRAMLFLALAAYHQASSATVFKCESGGGKVEYQATPCLNKPGSAQTVLPSSSPASAQSTQTRAEKKKCAGKEMSIDFTDMPLTTTLKIIADFSGNGLSASSSIQGSGAFHYTCVAWDTVLKDIASKYNLATKIEGGIIHVQPR